MNQSGDFNSSSDEIYAVASYLQWLGIDTTKCKIEKFGQDHYGNDTNAKSAGDIYVTLPDKTYLLFEVKEEKFDRIVEYNQLGIDFISSFRYKDETIDHSKWTHPHSGIIDYQQFIQSIDTDDAKFKWGKVGYSSSDIWLFYCKDQNEYVFADGYDFVKMKECHFFNYLKDNCLFAENSKNKKQLSCSDTWRSATFYIDRFQMEKYKINSIQNIHHDSYNFADQALNRNRNISQYNNLYLPANRAVWYEYARMPITAVPDVFLQYIIQHKQIPEYKLWAILAQKILDERKQMNITI